MRSRLVSARTAKQCFLFCPRWKTPGFNTRCDAVLGEALFERERLFEAAALFHTQLLVPIVSASAFIIDDIERRAQQRRTNERGCIQQMLDPMTLGVSLVRLLCHLLKMLTAANSSIDGL